MNFLRKNSSLLILLSLVAFSAITQDLIAVPTRRAVQQASLEKKKLEEQKVTGQEKKQQNEKRTFKETWSKVVRLRWSKLDKKDVWNIFLTTATIGGVLGVGYAYKRHQYNLYQGRLRLEQERLDRERRAEEILEEVRREQARQAQQRQERERQEQGRQNQSGSQGPARRQRPQYHDPRPPAVLAQRVVLANNVECSVCLDDIDEVVQEINQLPCGTQQVPHRFCTNCLRQQITTALRELNLPICPHQGCNHQLTERHIRLVTDNDPQVVQRFDEANFRQGITSGLLPNQQIIFCPGQDCRMSWVREENGQFTFTCNQCETRFCSNCHHNHNQDITCDQARQHETRQSENWIRNNTKQCPACHNGVERNGGCNHMTCRCGTHFCWTCENRAVDGHSNDPRVCDSYRCATRNERVWG